MSHRARTAGGCSIVILLMTAIGCIQSPETALERLLESRRLASDLLVQFTKAADASNRAVMADTDDASKAFAHERARRNRDCGDPRDPGASSTAYCGGR